MQQRTFKLTNIRSDRGGDGQGHIITEGHLFDLGLALEDRNPRFQVGMPDLCDQPPGEPAL